MIQNMAVFVLLSNYCSIFLERTLIILMISGLAPLRGARVWMPSDISEFSVVKEKEQLNGLKSLIASAYFNQKYQKFQLLKKNPFA